MEALLKKKLGRESRDYLAITFGLICYAIGWAAFYCLTKLQQEE